MRGELPYTPSEGRRKRVRVDSLEPPAHSLPGGGVAKRGGGGDGFTSDSTSDHQDEPTTLPDSPVKKRIGGLPAARIQSIDDSSSFRAIFDDLPPIKSDSLFKPRRVDSLQSGKSSRSRTPNPLDDQRHDADTAHRADLKGAEQLDDETDGSAPLLPPSPPPNDKAIRATATSSKHSGVANMRKRKSKDDPDAEMIEVPMGSGVAAEDDSDISSFIVTRAVPWQAVQIRKNPLEDVRGSAIEDEGVEGIGQLFSRLNRTSPTPPLLHPPTDPRGTSQDSDLEGDFSRTLSMSQMPDAYLEEERHEAMLLQQLLTNAGGSGKNGSYLRESSGAVWDAGEGDDVGEDWESEPEGWNASPDL